MEQETKEPEKNKGELEGTKGLDMEKAKQSWGFKGQNYLFTIGIDRYKHWPPLHCAVKDVEDFAKVLLDHYQFDEDNWISLKDEEATEQQILSKFRDLAKMVTPEDNLIMYFSGHGHYDEVTKTGYWIPVNARKEVEYEHEFINTAIVVDRLKNINSLHTLLVIDACFSGTLVTQIRSSPRSERYKSRRVFTSGRAEVVHDGPEGGNSPFARGILYNLKQNTDKYVPASKLIVDVTEYVEKESQQTPTDARLVNADDQGGDFVFHLKMSEAEIWASVVQQNTKDAYRKFIEQFPQSEHQPEAREAYDWLTAREEDSLHSLQQYLNKYQPGGKHVPVAIKTLKEIEEEQFWEQCTNKDTLSYYYDYLYKYPEGKHAKEALQRTKQMSADTDDESFREAIEKNTTEAYQDYVKKSGNKKHVEKAEKKLSNLTAPSSEALEEKKAWKSAQETDTYEAYYDFTEAYPQSRFLEEARTAMKRMDDIALNQIRLMESKKNMAIQDKVKQCVAYFDKFPGAPNNQKVKQIKDRLEIQRYSQGL